MLSHSQFSFSSCFIISCLWAFTLLNQPDSFKILVSQSGPCSRHFSAKLLKTSSATSPQLHHNQCPSWAHPMPPFITSRSSDILHIPPPTPPPLSKLHGDGSNSTYGISTALKISWHHQRLIFLNFMAVNSLLLSCLIQPPWQQAVFHLPSWKFFLKNISRSTDCI